MGQIAMTVLSLQEAVERTGTSKVDIWRAIQVGTLSAKKTDDGGFAIDPEDLIAVFETKQADQRPMAEKAVASVEASESPETSVPAETAGTEFKGVLEPLTEASTSYELRQSRDERPAVELAERNAHSPNRPLSEQKSKRWLNMLRWRMNSPGGDGSSDGSKRVVAGQRRSDSGKGCMAEHDRRRFGRRLTSVEG